MKVTQEISIENFQAWSGAKDTQKAIIDANKVEEFDNLIEELYPDGIDAKKLNDILWFEPEWIAEMLNIEIE